MSQDNALITLVNKYPYRLISIKSGAKEVSLIQ